jgi:hypothetical protein
MYNINSVQHSYNTQVNKTSPLRNAAISPNPPKLTSDESSLIKEKFTPSKQLKLYTGDGNTQSTGFERGLNLDTRI